MVIPGFEMDRHSDLAVADDMLILSGSKTHACGNDTALSVDIAYVLYGKAYSLDGSPIASQDLVKTILSDHRMVYLKRSKALRGLGVTHCDSSNLAREIASCSGAIIQRPLTIHALKAWGPLLEAFQQEVAEWLDATTHPDTGLPYDEMTYQPMVELLRYLRDEGFKTYIVSGGGLHFMRVCAEEAYGIPPEWVLGT